MAEFRINDLNPVVLVDADNPDLIVDDPSYPEAQRVSRNNLTEAERNARILMDNAIIDGGGLEVDGSMTAIGTSTYLRNSDFSTAALDINLKNGLRLLDVALSTLTGQLYYTVQATLTSAEILAINATPLVKWPAPGAGLIYNVWEIIAKNNFGTVAYASAGANGIHLRFTAAADFIVHLDLAFLQAVATQRVNFPKARHVMEVNTGLELFAPDGDPINGDGTIDIILTYVIQSDFTSASPTSLCCVTPLWNTFTNADLNPLGELVITHSLVTERLFCAIIDNNGTFNITTFTLGNSAGADTLNNITVPIGLGIPGTWTWIIYAMP